MANNYGKGLFWGLLIGSMAGLLTGALMSPTARKRVVQVVADSFSKAMELGDRLQDHVESGAPVFENESKMRGEALVKEATERAQELLGDAERILAELKSQHDSSLHEKIK